MDISGAYLDNIRQQANISNKSNAASSLNKATNGLSKDSTKEELTEAVKSFESYFVEEMLKNVKESMTTFGGDSSSVASQYTDYFMDFAISDVARNIVDRYGNRLTEDLVSQMQRNYGITDTDSTDSES